MAIRFTAHARYDLWYHVVWATKYRQRIFTEVSTRERVKTLFRTIAAHYDMGIHTIECAPDHVHMLLTAPPRIAPAQAVQILKSVSTKLLFQEFPWLKQYYWGGEIWVGGYFVRSVGPGLTKEHIEAYILAHAEEL
jgi:putative transposase